MHMSCEFEERFVQTFETTTLKGERVTLVGLRESDVEAVYALVQESREHLMAHLPWVQDTSVTDIKKKVRSWVLAEQLSQGGCWKIMLSGNGASKFAGVIMMEVRLSNHSATISYWLGEGFCGKGYMTESLKALAKFCLCELGLHRLEITASVNNPQSAAVALRAGFKEEGLCREYEIIGDAFVDHRLFSLLKTDLVD